MKQNVLSFFKEKLGNEINSKTNLNNLVYGLDAVGLMSQYFDEFEIENDKDFEIFSFFLEELNLFDFLKKRRKKRMKDKRSLTINHLIKVAEEKYWFNPVD